MKVLFIGGTGNISSAVSRQALAQGLELWLLNRGTRPVELPGARSLVADIKDEAAAAAALAGQRWDAVVDWIAYTPADVERDLRLFAGRTAQYVFISSAAVYQKPPAALPLTEDTPLANPYWEYARLKIACEERLRTAQAREGWPVTIVRPSHTYDTVIPIPFGGWRDYTVVERLRRGLPVIVHGDGTSLWTLTHADDFARGFLGLLGRPEALGQAYHITGDEWLTWDQVFACLGAALGVEPRLVHIPSELLAALEPNLRGGLLGDKSHSAIFDNRKLKALVPGFRADIPFRTGIARTLAWFEADPARRQVSPGSPALYERLLAAYARAWPGPPPWA